MKRLFAVDVNGCAPSNCWASVYEFTGIADNVPEASRRGLSAAKKQGYHGALRVLSVKDLGPKEF